VAKQLFDASQWILDPMIETDPGFVFNPSSSPAATWVRAKEEKLIKPAAGSQEDIDDSLLRYSYASITYDLNANELAFSVESYASSLISNLDHPNTILGTGLNTNQWLCLPGSTIFQQNNASQAVVKDAQGNVVGDSYNPLLSALRSCGLLAAILDRIKLEAFETLDGLEFTHVANKIDAFANSPTVKVALTPVGPGVQKTELALATFRKIVSNTCP